MADVPSKAAAPARPSAPPEALYQPSAFEMAMVGWESCERPRMREMGRRLGMAGPGGNADLDSLGDCSVAEGRLTAAIEALLTAAERDAARAQVDKARAGFRVEMQQIYDGNNHE
jgi:hypothetical protein